MRSSCALFSNLYNLPFLWSYSFHAERMKYSEDTTSQQKRHESEWIDALCS